MSVWLLALLAWVVVFPVVVVALATLLSMVCRRSIDLDRPSGEVIPLAPQRLPVNTRLAAREHARSAPVA
jgi:hypothetical protein